MKTTEQQHNERKRELMEKCFECYSENGLTGTGIKAPMRADARKQICIRILKTLMNLSLSQRHTVWKRLRMTLWRWHPPTPRMLSVL